MDETKQATPGNTKIAAALVAAQAELRHAKLDRVNPHYHNRYATLTSVLDACRGALNAHGIAVVQRVRSDAQEGEVCVCTVLLHESGEEMNCGELWLKATQNNPQQFGSALTYARRYALAAAVGIASDDDDDAEAGSAPPARAASSAAPASSSVPRGTVVAPTPPPPTPPARAQAHADAPAGGPSPSTPRFPGNPKDKTISQPQAKRLWAIAQGWLDSGGIAKDSREAAIKTWLADLCGVEHTAELTWRQYKALGLDDDSGRDDLLRAAAFSGGAPDAPGPEPSDQELVEAAREEDDVPF